MEQYFNLKYEFDRDRVHDQIAERLKKPGSDYVCVADGVILNNVNRDDEYASVVNGGMFSICDSSYVPLYIKWLYGKERQQYCGSEIFKDIVSSGKYRMIFMGTHQNVLDHLKDNLSKLNREVCNMQFIELPFLPVEKFDYASIAELIKADGADIIWIALGAPKQERFMANLKPYLTHGVMIAVGAAFKFYSGFSEKRAPEWAVKNHLEFVYRIMQDPKKQLKRCRDILFSLPKILYQEKKRKDLLLK